MDRPVTTFPDPGRRPRVSPSTLAGLAILLAVAAICVLVRAIYDLPLSGDEPHYLVTTNSLLVDGDFDVKNDYLEQRYVAYHPPNIDPHVDPTLFSEDSPHWYPLHGVGLPVLIAPFVKAWGVHAGSKIAMVLVAMSVVLLGYKWARRFTADRVAPWIGVLVLVASPAFLALEGRIFPDLVSAALILGCLLIVESARRRWHFPVMGLVVAAGVWIHFKIVLVLATAALVLLYEAIRADQPLGQRFGNLALLTAPAAISWVGYLFVVHAWFGTWSPASAFPPGNDLFAIAPTTGVIASLLDGTKGVLTNDPGLLLLLPGLLIWAHRYRAPVLRLIVILGPSVALHATFNDWSGGYAPSGRYVLQYLPALLPAGALAYQAMRRSRWRLLFAATAAAQVALAATAIAVRPSWTYAGVPNPLYQEPGGIGLGLDRFMPQFDPGARLITGGPWLFVWVSLSMGMVWLGARWSGPEPVSPSTT